MSIRPGAARTALLACLLAVLAPLLLAPPASASTGSAPRSHVIVVGLSGLRWSDVSATATPALLGDLRAQGLPAAIIGEVTDGTSGQVQVEFARSA